MKIPSPVEAVLAMADIDDDAMTVRLTGTLDRKAYVAVDKVLQALGGKWNRKAQAHVFAGPPSIPMRAAMTTKSVLTHADIQFFRTPPAVVETLLELVDVQSGDECLEPSAGDGAIVGALLDRGAKVRAFELDPDKFTILNTRYGARADVRRANFMEVPAQPYADAQRVIMNPPFARVHAADCIDHVRHAMDFISHGVLGAVLPISIKFREDKRFREFRQWVHSSAFSSCEIIDLPEDAFVESGTRVRTCILVLHRRD